MGTAYHLLPVSVQRLLSRYKSQSRYTKKLIDFGVLGVSDEHVYDLIPVKYRSVPEISSHYTFYSALPKYLRWEDRNSMAHSVEARVPFLDHRLVEFCSNLPDEYLEKGGITKRVMREGLRKIVPEVIRTRKDKKGFVTPEEGWVKRENPDLFRQKMREAIDVTCGVIKPGAMNYIEEIIDGRMPFDYTYWRFILFSEWIKKFDVKL
jgi:asparagine synthase (glutamine-hydrolysing)